MGWICSFFAPASLHVSPRFGDTGQQKTYRTEIDITEKLSAGKCKYMIHKEKVPVFLSYAM